jgi:anti-sigma factor RsiW
MNCLPEGTLRAYLDEELAPAKRQEAVRHVAACPRCAERLAVLRRAADVARAVLAGPRPAGDAHTRQALARLRAQLHEQRITPTRVTWRDMLMRNNRVWRPVLAGLATVAILVGIFSFAPSRALARQLLSVFRVRRFAVIQVNPDQARLEQVAKSLEDKLLGGQPEVIADEPAVKVASLEEARRIAGFEVRMPRYFPGGSAPTFSVKGRSEQRLRFNRDGLVTLLQLADMDPKLVPAGFSEGAVTVLAPVMVAIASERYQIAQVRSPSITYPDGLEPRIVGEAGLRLMGLSAADAKRISATIDWTTTVVLPIPASIAEFREVEIAGSRGVMFWGREQKGQQNTAVLMWEKNDVVYMVSGPNSQEQLVQVAQSMF